MTLAAQRLGRSSLGARPSRPPRFRPRMPSAHVGRRLAREAQRPGRPRSRQVSPRASVPNVICDVNHFAYFASAGALRGWSSCSGTAARAAVTSGFG
jgi:hypothetical protein